MEKEKIVTISSLLTKGNEHIEEVETPAGVFEIRPLTWGEKAEIQSSSMSGVKSKTKASIKDTSATPEETEVDIDFVQMQKQQWEAKFKVVAYGLSVRKQRYNADTIKKVPLTTETLDILHDAILAISEVTPSELVPFREDGDGSDDSEHGEDGSSTSPNSG